MPSSNAVFAISQQRCCIPFIVQIFVLRRHYRCFHSPKFLSSYPWHGWPNHQRLNVRSKSFGNREVGFCQNLWSSSSKPCLGHFPMPLMSNVFHSDENSLQQTVCLPHFHQTRKLHSDRQPGHLAKIEQYVIGDIPTECYWKYLDCWKGLQMFCSKQCRPLCLRQS